MKNEIYFSSVFRNVYAATIITSILLGYFVEYLVGISGISYIIFFSGFLLLGLKILMEEKIELGSKLSTYIVVISILLLCISVFFWTGVHNINSYLSILIAYTVYLYAFKEVKNAIVIILFISLVIAIYENLQGEFLFAPPVKGIEGAVLEGEPGYIFRAKGLLPGPLTLGQLSVLAVILMPEKWWLPILGIACSALAVSRFGIFLNAAMFLINIGRSLKLKRIIVLAAVVITVVFSGAEQLIDTRSFDRMANVTNFNEKDPGIDASNIQRMYIWLSAISFYQNYDWVHKTFGNNGAFFKREETNPESGWLSLLVDNGIAGALFYLLVFSIVFIRTIRSGQYINLVYSMILFVGMIPYTLNLSREGALVFWLIIFSLINKTGQKEIAGQKIS